MTDALLKGQKFTAWTSILGGVFALANVGLVVSVTGEDTGMIFHGASMLALPPDARNLFRWGMLADVLGFYLPFLVMGGYLWRAFRESSGLFGDIALFAIVCYVVVGMAGAGMQQAALDALAHLHSGGDDSVKAAAEAAWTAVVYGAQKGLWWCEGPLVLFWGLIVASQLKRSGRARWLALVLQIIAWFYGLYFISGFFASLDDVTDLLETIAVLLLPVWMIWFGSKLLRAPLKTLQ